MVAEIKVALEQAIKDIEVKKERAVAGIKDRIIKEKVVPFNAELDNSRNVALAALDKELNEKIAVLRKEYEVKKQELIALGEQKKKEKADAIFAVELATYTVDYDNAIAKLKAQLDETKN